MSRNTYLNSYGILNEICGECDVRFSTCACSGKCLADILPTDNLHVQSTSNNCSSLESNTFEQPRQHMSDAGNATARSPQLSSKHGNSIAETPQISFKYDNQNSETKFLKRGIHIANLNIRHLKPKLDEIKIMLSSSNSIDVLGTCETFLNNSIPDDVLVIADYTFERKDRSDRDGGGILVFVSNHLNYIRRHDLEAPDIESIWIEIKVKNSKSFLVCSVYRPPSSASEWYENFSIQIEKSLGEINEIYIMGDLNVDFQNQTLTNNKWKHIIELQDL